MEISSRNDVVQVEEHGVNIKDQVNDPMEEDDMNNTVGDDETNTFIQDAFSWMDHEKFDDIHDVPLLEKAQQPLYEGSWTNILSDTLLLASLEVLNGLSKTCLTQILR